MVLQRMVAEPGIWADALVCAGAARLGMWHFLKEIVRALAVRRRDGDAAE